MKLHKSLVFTPSQLSLYLRSMKEWGKKEHEIAVSLICLKVYRDIIPGKYFIALPPRGKYEKELNKSYGRSGLTATQLRDFLNHYWEENTDTDVVVLREDGEDPKKPYLIPLQIKRFGLGAESDGDTQDFIDFLKKLKKFPRNENRLIIVREKVRKLKPQKIVEWLNNNEFSFPEVILLHQKPNMDMELYQLKPNKGTFSVKLITKEQIINIH